MMVMMMMMMMMMIIIIIVIITVKNKFTIQEMTMHNPMHYELILCTAHTMKSRIVCKVRYYIMYSIFTEQ